MHTYIHTYIVHIYVRTYVHTYVHTYKHNIMYTHKPESHTSCDWISLNLYSNISTLFQILVALYKKIRKSQEIKIQRIPEPWINTWRFGILYSISSHCRPLNHETSLMLSIAIVSHNIPRLSLLLTFTYLMNPSPAFMAGRYVTWWSSPQWWNTLLIYNVTKLGLWY